jgi:hypothetical protein
LVYGALEARSAIEQLAFELVVLCRPTLGISMEDFDDCKKSLGVFDVLRRFEPDYLKLAQFTKLCLGVDSEAPEIIVWDIRKLRRCWNDVSKYCHYQGIASETIASNLDAWLSKGVALIEEIFSYFAINMKGAQTDLLKKETMPPEVLQTWEEFRSEKIDVPTVKRRLQIMQPAMRKRRLFLPPSFSAE